jgi:hypothetical protein
MPCKTTQHSKKNKFARSFTTSYPHFRLTNTSGSPTASSITWPDLTYGQVTNLHAHCHPCLIYLHETTTLLLISGADPHMLIPISAPRCGSSFQLSPPGGLHPALQQRH